MTSRISAVWFCSALALASASCGRDPEAFCADWVEATCTTLAACCKTGSAFDPAQCRLGTSKTCQQNTNADGVQAGQRVFDSGAAADCMSPVSCSDPLGLLARTFDRQKACFRDCIQTSAVPSAPM